MPETLDHQHLDEVAVRLHEEFTGVFGETTIEQVLYDSLQRLTEGAHYTAFVPLLVERFTRERLRAAARAVGHRRRDKPTVLFLCVHNAGRSQMAAGWMHHLTSGRVEVLSAGSKLGETVNPTVIAAMAEVGIDISSYYPKPCTEDTLSAADVVITMGCGDACPVLPDKRYLDWDLPDPAGQPLEAIRPLRDDIEQRVRDLMAELGIRPV